MKTKFRAGCAALFILTVLSACNTVEGMGKDMERGGENMQDTAREQKYKNDQQ